MVTVAQLIEHLKAFSPDLPIAYDKYSEACLMSLDEIRIEICGKARPDGWIPDLRNSTEPTQYLIFPGN